MIYRWRDGSHLRGDPKKVAKHLERIANKHGGGLRPSDVVENARSKTSPIHDYFEWDDATAAETYRQEQARHLIRSIQVITVDDAEPVRAFHHVTLTTTSEEDDIGRGYVTLERAASEERLRLQVIRRLYAQARAFAREARAFEEFAGVVKAFEELPPLQELERKAAAAA